MDVLGRDEAAAKQAATLLLTNPGVPFIYYSEEIGLRGRKPDERIRTPMPWTAAGPGYGFTSGEPWEAMADGVDIANVAPQTDDRASLLSWYRTLIAARAGHPALSGGQLVPLQASERGVYAVLRVDDASPQTVVVVSSLTDEPMRAVTLSLTTGPLCGSPETAVIAATASDTLVQAPVVAAGGGLEGWSIGALPARGDLLVSLTP